MGDLNKKQTARSVQIMGADTNNSPTAPVHSFSNQDLGISDVIHTGGTNGDVSVGTTAIIARVGATNLTDRKFVRIYNSGNTKLYWGFKSNTTSSAGANAGEPIYKKTWITVSAVSNVDIYIVSGAAGGVATIIEGG